LGDILSSAYQQAQLNLNVFSPKTVSVGDLFVGAIFPGLLLVALYCLYIGVTAIMRPDKLPPAEVKSISWGKLLDGLLPPLALIAIVLGSILAGAATPTEAAGVGATGAFLLAWFRGELNLKRMQEIVNSTLQVTAMVFMILIGAAVFSLVFRGFGGEELIQAFFAELPGGVFAATALVMAIIFLLGFVLDFIEISFVVVPIVGPILLMMGVDPIWLGIMIAINLQTSFLTPPFGFALFYLRGVAPDSVPTGAIYRGVIPFIFIQLLVLGLLWMWPGLATWLPSKL
jgi:tripartite ATP-independent transporter DctM subunit